jgi:predicted nucleotidyltransferase component of viral defense system
VIQKGAILERAAEWQLTPDIVEKDYVLGWLLAAVASNPATASNWVFKGGTCLKKCVIETWRFSEDLDFTLRPAAAYDAASIGRTLVDITTYVTELSGIQFPTDGVRVRERKDKAGRPTFEASVGYVGPMAIPGPPKVRFDLTQYEPVLRSAQQRDVFHPYPDELPAGTRVNCYSTGELIAEKTRALFERTRPRDLYDVALLHSVAPPPGDLSALRELAREKFAVKGLALPTAAELVQRATESAELKGEWKNMLAHQLPALPPLDDVLGRLPDAVAWLDEARPEVRPAIGGVARVAARTGAHVGGVLTAVPLRPGEANVPGGGVRLWGGGARLEAVRFAGANRLLMEFGYHGARRTIEPYSLRQPKTGNLLLYGYERSKNGFATNDIRAYKVDEISDVQVLSQSFVPQYSVELTEQPGVWRW